MYYKLRDYYKVQRKQSLPENERHRVIGMAETSINMNVIAVHFEIYNTSATA